ncbi:MAG: HipA domain-containing protein [Prolixibacteraceae bacterium]|nr:HipA domain-containing protein [Prolixibacteraceae bacterium]
MNTERCLYCYKELTNDERILAAGKSGFHGSCSKKIFETAIPPELPYTEDDMLKLAEQVIKSQKTVTGVQPKLSLGIQNLKDSENPKRFTIIGLWGEFILKPQTKDYLNLPELEDLTMHLAEIAKIRTVNHSLIHLKSGQLAYITKRVDRNKGKKLHMEDMCQLTERLTEHKYRGSYEQIAKAILKYSANPGLDVINFYEQVLFSFFTGNSDMHLKNFSLLKANNVNYNLCPAYDLVATQLVVEGDDEELALNLNGKKKKLKRTDFETAMKSAGIEEKTIENVFNRFAKSILKWHEFIDISFVPDELKSAYHRLIDSKQKQIQIK